LKRANELALQQAEMSMIGWMYGVKLSLNELSCIELSQWIGIECIVNVVHRNRLG